MISLFWFWAHWCFACRLVCEAVRFPRNWSYSREALAVPQSVCLTSQCAQPLSHFPCPLVLIINSLFAFITLPILKQLLICFLSLENTIKKDEISCYNLWSLLQRAEKHCWYLKQQHNTGVLWSNSDPLPRMALKEWPSRDCLIWGSIPNTDTKPRYHYGCQEMLAERSL